MKIKILEKSLGCLPQEFEVGEWYDLKTTEEISLRAPQANKMHRRNQKKENGPEERTRDVDFDWCLIKLGIAMEIPKGYEAIIVPRSSMFKDWGLLQTNSIGVIDNTYKGDNDEWKLSVVATRNITIPKDTRLCQFRIQLSQKATRWQKIKWLLSNKNKFVQVEALNNPDRGGFGTTGKQ